MSGLDFYAVYKKYGRAKYISHLDMVRVFNRVFRRGGIPIAYSEGFNPHPKISFALPLPVFYESECEVLLFSLSEDMPEEELLKRFSSAMPEGLTVTGVFRGKPRVKELDSALYIVSSENVPSPDELEKFLSMDAVIIPKKTKSGINDTDIKPDIRDIKIKDGKMEMRLSAGSRANLKPEVVINAMNKYIAGFFSGDCEYLRTALFDEKAIQII